MSHIIEFPIQQPAAIFLLVLVIILLAPMLLRRLKIPNIIVMIIAGAAIGPHGFNLLARDASFEIFGQVGILYLMFLAAVEIDMYNLKVNSRKGIVFGIITFLVPMLLGLLTGRLILKADWLTCVLVGSMYSSHTLVSYPIINRFGLGNSRAVVVSLCSTIVAVMLALVALAEVASIADDGGMYWNKTAELLVLMVLYTVAVGVSFPWITRKFLRSVSDPVTQFIYILAMVFIASLLAQIIGLEAIIGAFYAGLVLNRFIPSRSALMRRIEFVGNAIFIPYFLIGVGMLINVRVIFSGWGVILVALTMTATGLGGKWISAWMAQKLFRFSGTDRRIMFGLTSGKAAATIAAAIVGYRYGLLTEDMMNGAVLMILVCCFVASITTERGAIKLRIDLTEEDLKQGPTRERHNAKQLVAVANPDAAEPLMKLAILLRHPKNRLPVTVLAVRNTDDRKTVNRCREALHLAETTAMDLDIPVKVTERFDINPATGVLNVMREQEISDLIVGLHHRSNIVDTFYGAMTEEVLTQSNRMIILSRIYVPVNTLSRIVVVVPDKAEYETGFRRWVERVGNLATQLSSEVLFMCFKGAVRYIRGVLSAGKYKIDYEFSEMESWDDFITLSSHIEDDDLMIVIAARRTSISFSSDLEKIPGFLTKYFANINLLVIYPEQFGDADEMPTPLDSVAQALTTNPTPTLFSLKRWRR